MASVCELDLEDYMQQHGIDAAWSAGERVMVCLDDQRQAQDLVRRGWRMANRYDTELLAVFVETPRWASAAPEQKRALEENLRFAEDLGAEPIRVQGSDVAKVLMQVAHEKNVGSIIIGHSRHGRLHEIMRGSIVQNLLRLAGDVDVHVVADRVKATPDTARYFQAAEQAEGSRYARSATEKFRDRPLMVTPIWLRLNQMTRTNCHVLQPAEDTLVPAAIGSSTQGPASFQTDGGEAAPVPRPLNDLLADPAFRDEIAEDLPWLVPLLQHADGYLQAKLTLFCMGA
jgi:K+-sensing histidine kinase KdpD